jgi:DNA-binding SARP family transcriptional activator
MLKLPAPDPHTQIEAVSVYPNVWNKLLGWLGLHYQRHEAPSVLHVEPRPAHHSRMPGAVYAASSVISAIATPPVCEPISQGLVARAPAAETTQVAATTIAPRSGNGIALELGQAIDTSPPGTAAPVAEAAPALTVYLLGPFRASLNDNTIENWPSSRGRAVFKYLLTQRHRPIPRDVLMDVFWPDADPEAARNNLHVALHGLRQALREVDDTPVVIFENGAYRLNPELAVWLDVEEFERHYKTAGRLETAGQLIGAITEYEAAISLYQDDFFVDDPYEEWPVLTRERLRVMFLEALDRLSQIYFAQGQYGSCASLCQRIVEHDSCREDAHCRLMRCYSRQGQRPLALRQFQICAEALRTDLDVEPSPATIDLHERIRRRELV